MSKTSPTRRIAEFAADRCHGPLPDEVAHAVRRAILDSIGVMAAGTRHPASQKVVEMLHELGTVGPSRIVGSTHRTDPVNAALANGVSAHVFDWDDTILPTRAHLSAALLPALVAAGETRNWSIDSIVPAFAVGFEIGARINAAVYPSVHLRGWQGTGIAGGAGSAAAIGRMLGLPADKLVHAIGIAATNASGLIATFGSMSKPLNIGRAGASGLQSALLAELGYTSNEDILGAGRFLDMFDDAPRHELLLDGLGETWLILENGYKPYPCGFVAHATIDAVRDLRAKAGAGASLRNLRLTVSPESMQLMGRANPTNELEAKFSLLYDAAVAWVDGNVSPAAFEDSAVGDPRYRTVMDVTRIGVGDAVAQHEAFAEADLDDGRTVSIHVEHARGTPQRPMSDDDLRLKFDSGLAIGGFDCGDALASLILSGEAEPVARIMDRLARKR
jgi:2-methylcitrate dehydratase PrpD